MMRSRVIRIPRAGICMVLGIAALTLTGCGVLLTPQFRIHRAEREMRAGEWSRAAFDLRTAVQKEPGNAKAWLLLVQLSLDAADPNGARSALQHAVAAGAKGPQVDALRARTWLATGQPQPLLTALSHHTLQLPALERSLWAARAQLEAGQPAQAVSLLRPLLAQQPQLVRARIVFAEALAQEGQMDQALRQLRRAEHSDPKSAEPHLLMGRIEAVLGDFPASESELISALALMAPNEPVAHRFDALVTLTDAQLALGKIPAAAKSQTALAHLAPHAPQTLLLAARIHLARGNLPRGVDELQRVVSIAPEFVQARVLLGAAFLRQGSPEQAKQQLQTALQLAPNDIAARKLLASVQLKLGEPQEALSVLTPALGDQVLDPQLLALYGRAARLSGNSHALLDALQRAVQQHPTDRGAQLNLARAYLAAGQDGKALALLQKDTDTADLQRDGLLITALQAVRGPVAARSQVQRLLAAAPKNSGVLALAAAFFAGAGDPAQAHTLLLKAHAVDPHNTAVLIDLAHVEETTGDVAAAQHRLQSALERQPGVLALRFALAGALLRTRSFVQARQVLQAAGAHAGPALGFALARVALAQGDLQAADAALDHAIAAQPNNVQLVAAAGTLLMQANEFSGALARFALATHMAPNNANYWLRRAQAQLALNQSLAARDSLEQAKRIRPHWLPVVGGLALIDLRQGNGQAAMQRVDALIERERNAPGPLALRGNLEMAMHQPAAAARDFAAALRLRPSGAAAVKLFQAQQAAHAPAPQRVLQSWLAREPGDWRVREVLANFDLLIAHQDALAVKEFTAVLAQAPENVVALNNAAWAMSRIGDPRALPLAQRAFRLAPKSASINDTLGWILARGGHNAQAVPYLRRATQLDTGNPDLQYHYAYVLAKTGQVSEARTILQRILAGSVPFTNRQAAQRFLARLQG